MNTAGPALTLQEEHQAAVRLFDLLKTEQQMLIDAKVDELPSLLEEKAGLVTRMSALASRRHQALAAAGFAAKEGGMQDWLASPAADAKASETWHAMLDTARAAKELNRTNGLLINRHMNISRATLASLRGEAVTDAIYGPNGQASSVTASRNYVLG